MDVIPTCSLTPDDFFGGGFEFHETDGTLAFDRFSFTVVVGVIGFGLLATDG